MFAVCVFYALSTGFFHVLLASSSVNATTASTPALVQEWEIELGRVIELLTSTVWTALNRPFLLSFLDLLLTVRVKLPPNGSYYLDYGLKVQKAGLCLSMGNRVKILCFPFKCHLNIIYWTNNIINITVAFILMKSKNALNSTILVNNFVSLCFLPDLV